MAAKKWIFLVIFLTSLVLIQTPFFVSAKVDSYSYYLLAFCSYSSKSEMDEMCTSGSQLGFVNVPSVGQLTLPIGGAGAGKLALMCDDGSAPIPTTGKCRDGSVPKILFTDDPLKIHKQLMNQKKSPAEQIISNIGKEKNNSQDGTIDKLK